MTLLRRFLVIQMLMLWQGGFLFYSAFVVPEGAEVLGGSFAQGRITRLVTVSMNWVGVTALCLFSWDLLLGRHSGWRRQWLWGSLLVMALGLAALFPIHERLLELVDFQNGDFEDRRVFRFWHRTYLWISTFQWIAGLIFAFVLVVSWRKVDQQA